MYRPDKFVDGNFCSWIGAAIGAAAALGSAFMQSNSASKQQEDSFEEAQRNREFQERMSSTAHQREVADLRAANLNPILSARHGGASSPSGSMGTAVDTFGEAARSGISTALQATRLESEIEQMTAATSATEEAANLSKQDQMLRGFQRENLREDTLKKAEEQKAIRAEEENKRKVGAILDEELQSAKAAAARDKAAEEFFNTDMGQLIRKFGIAGKELDPFIGAFGSAKSVLGGSGSRSSVEHTYRSIPKK